MAADRKDAGFTLIEVLVALVVAAVFLEVLTRAMANSWTVSRRPMEQVAALAVARAAAVARAHNRAEPAAAFMDPFRYETSIEPLLIERRPANLPPAPENSNAADRSAAVQGSAPRALPQRIRVLVSGPSGRRLIFETITVDAGPN